MKKPDYSKYDLTLNGQRVLNLPKNRAICEVVGYILHSGVDAREISKLDFGLRPNQLLIGVDGEVNSEEFIRHAKLNQEAAGSWFDPVRYFCQDNELIKLNGRTYAVNSQWTGKLFHKAMSQFKQDYAYLNIEFSPAVKNNLTSLKSNELKSSATNKLVSKKDKTRYDIDLNGFTIVSLAKNRAIFYVVRYLLENGVSPIDLAEKDFGLWYNKKLIVGVEGKLNSEEFIRLATVKQKNVGETFDSTRYYCREKELVKVNGWTFAIYNQWTAESFNRVITFFKRVYPNIKFDYSAIE